MGSELVEKDKTVGEHVKKLLDTADDNQSLMDTSNEMTKEFLPQVEECIKNHADWIEPYYVVIINKRERLMVNVIRQYFLARKTLPTPDYDQTVFKYFPFSGDLEYLWSLPDKNTIEYLILNENMLPKEQSQLLQFCKLFKDGRLDEICGK